MGRIVSTKFRYSHRGVQIVVESDRDDVVLNFGERGAFSVPRSVIVDLAAVCNDAITDWSIAQAAGQVPPVASTSDATPSTPLPS